MANEKTILLSGTEQKIKAGAQNCGIRNDGVDMVYISRNPNIVPDADGVLSVPAGQAAKYYELNGYAYLLGTGKVQLNFNDYSTQDFRVAATSSGEGGADVETLKNAVSALTKTVSQNAEQLTEHAEDVDIHLTAEKAIEAVTSVISNDDLLINPDFSINQRGLAEYTGTGIKHYTVDGWYSQSKFKVTPLNSGLRITPVETLSTYVFALCQRTECTSEMYGKDLVFSLLASLSNQYALMRLFGYGSTNNIVQYSENVPIQQGTITSAILRNISADVKYIIAQVTFATGAGPTDILELNRAKLEYGSVATPFAPLNPAIELIKCQRYYQVRSTGDIDPVDLRPSMAEITDIVQREDGNYAYIAEL